LATELYFSRLVETDSQTVVLISITSLTLSLYFLFQVFCIKRIGKISTRLCQSFQMLIFKKQLFLTDFPSCNQLETWLFTIEYSRLLMNFKVFRLPGTIPSNPASNSIDSLSHIELNGPNGDIENPSSIWKQETNRSAVDSSGLGLQVLDDFHGRNFRCSRYGTAWKERTEDFN